MAIWFQLPSFWKKKEEEKAPMMSVNPSIKEKTAVAPQMSTPVQKAGWIPTKPMMSYNIEGTILSGVADDKATKILDYAKKNAKTPEEEKLLLKDMHTEAIKMEQKKMFEKDRTDMKAQIMKDVLKEPDPVKQKQIGITIKLAEFADTVRDWSISQWIDPNDNDDQSVSIKFIEANPQFETTFTDFVNWKITNVDLGKQIGLIPTEEEPVEEEKNSLQQFVTPMVRFLKWLADTWAWVEQWIDRLLWVNKEWNILWREFDEKMTQQLLGKKAWVENYIQEAGRIAWATAMTAPILWLWATTKGLKWAQLAAQLAKNVWVGAAEWLANTAAYNLSTWEWVWNPVNLWIWAALWWAIPLVWPAVRWLKKAPEKAAKIMTKTTSGQDKLFKALSPRLNVLNKNVNFKTIKESADMANELIIKAWHKPIDTETRRIAHEATMKSTWAKVEKLVKNRKTLAVDQRQFAKIIEDTVADVKKSWLVKNTADIKALEAEAKAMRSQQFIDIPSLEKKKQYINGIVNNRWDSAIGDVYKNWMKKVTRAIGEAEDKLLSNLPWKFSTLKKEFWALKSTYEDVIKSDLKNQKSKWLDIMESYSRIEGIGDIIWWTLSMFTKWWAWLVDAWKWVGKLFMGKALKKMKDVDFLIEQWFNDLSSKIKPNAAGATISKSMPMSANTKKLTNTLKESKQQFKTQMKAPEEPLITEARKYKSAEEFIEAKMYEKPKYWISHRPTFEGSPPAHNLLEWDMLPRDVYSKPEWSIASMWMKDPAVKESRAALQKIKWNPNAEITIYRASPKNELNVWDRVSFSKKYAEWEWVAEWSKVFAHKVKAKDIYFAGDDINEFWYLPKDKLKQIREEANSKWLKPKK